MAAGLLLAAASAGLAHAGDAPAPYDFSPAAALLLSELANLDGNVAVIVRQNGADLFRFQAGDIDFDTTTRMASLTKTVSAGVILSLVDDDVMQLGERIGDALPVYDASGIGDPTVLECWSMTHGIRTPVAYHRSSLYTLAESIALIGINGEQALPPGTTLEYDGLAQHSVGGIAVSRTGIPWEGLATERIFDPCGMTGSDYQQFTPNPAIAGGLRASAEDVMRYAEMVIDGGVVAETVVLSPPSVQRLFRNETRNLPVSFSPFPRTHPAYPYGVDPDYGFGTWIFAEHPTTQHVEEIVGAGAWGSFVWIDRRRGLTATLVTDITPTTQASMDAALGLFAISRAAVEAEQVMAVDASFGSPGIAVTWTAPDAASTVKVYGAPFPIQDVYDLRAATVLAEVDAADGTVVVPSAGHYAVTASFDGFENLALIPGGNVVERPEPCPADLDGSGEVGFLDLTVVLTNWGTPGPGDVNGNGFVGINDLVLVLASWGPCD